MKSSGVKQVKVLITDDDEDDFLITGDFIKAIPSANYKIDWCYKYDEALKKMLQCEYDIYLVDYRLGAKSGIELLNEALKSGCEEPIILLTGKGNKKVDIEAMEMGATDYLIKTDLNTEKLERSLRYALERTSYLKALRANERKYRNIFEKSKDIVFLADDNLCFIDVNDAVAPMLGFTKEEILNLPVTNYIEQAQHKKYFIQALQLKKEIKDWEVVFTSKSGENIVCIMSAAVEVVQGEKDYVQGIIHDITSLKKAEKVNWQTEKLAAAGRLVRTLAHEVRNPLNNITLSVEQLFQAQLIDDQELYLKIIQRNSKRINDLIGELLNTSRPSDITLEDSTLQNILDEVINSAIDRLTLKRIKLQVSYPDDALHLKADKEKLKIALLNIVINAIEAMEERKGELQISLHGGDEYNIIKITDNGSGISEENISRLYEPYFTQKRNGVGLGLAFTFNILQSHGAHIDVNSTVGKGTSFIISIPIS